MEPDHAWGYPQSIVGLPGPLRHMPIHWAKAGRDYNFWFRPRKAHLRVPEVLNPIEYICLRFLIYSLHSLLIAIFYFETMTKKNNVTYHIVNATNIFLLVLQCFNWELLITSALY